MNEVSEPSLDGYALNNLLLKSGDSVEIIAPASRSSDAALQHLVGVLSSWGLNCLVDKDIFDKDLLCANSDLFRFELLKKAIENKQTKALFCVRGGYGSMRLIPMLSYIKPLSPKLFVGMSDITALHLFLDKHWQWPFLHASLSEHVCSESVNAVKSVLFGEAKPIAYQGLPLNKAAAEKTQITLPLLGGNLTLIQASIGTAWQLDPSNRMIFIEEVGERGYRIDRMLNHLQQAGLFDKAKAILLGDFIKGDEPNGSSLIEPVLLRFAEGLPIPVVQIKGIGHGPRNFPLPLGVTLQLHLGDCVRLVIR